MSAVTSEAPAGLQVMEAIRTGALPPPPAALLLGLEIDEVAEGRITFGFTSGDRFSNGATTHGGVLAAVADFALSTAVMTKLGANADLVTTNLNVTYLRPARLSGRFRCEGRVVSLGRTIAHAEAAMTDDVGREVLRAAGAFYLRQAAR
ncbi:MAG: PaaI family thioesterase [Microthrixaceae bacterium]